MMSVALSIQTPRGARRLGYVPSMAHAEAFSRAFRPAFGDAGSVAGEYRERGSSWMPTIVTTGSVYQYLDAVDASVNALGQSLTPTVLALLGQTWATAWTSFLVRWKKFFGAERAETHYLDARSTMSGIDGFYDELTPLDRAARAKGAQVATPPITPPPDGGGFGLGLGLGSLIAGAAALYLLTRH